MSDAISLLSLLAIHLGFASVFGRLVFRLRSGSGVRFAFAGLALSGLVFIPATMALPLPAWGQALLWVGAVAVVWLYAHRPARFPSWPWTTEFGLRYAGGAMALILLWSLMNGFTPQSSLMGLSATLAGGLAWRRGSTLAA